MMAHTRSYGYKPVIIHDGTHRVPIVTNLVIIHDGTHCVPMVTNLVIIHDGTHRVPMVTNLVIIHAYGYKPGDNS